VSKVANNSSAVEEARKKYKGSIKQKDNENREINSTSILFKRAQYKNRVPANSTMSDTSPEKCNIQLVYGKKNK
jgi:hypothetical protein